MKNEKGTILVESTLYILLALAFLLGAAKVHASWKKRHHAILEHRNKEIRALRLEKAELLPPTGLPGLERIGLPFARAK